MAERHIVAMGGGGFSMEPRNPRLDDFVLSLARLLAVWRLHALDKALRAAWNAGVVMAGISAGAICWFEDGLTDSFGMRIAASTTDSDSCAAP